MVTRIRICVALTALALIAACGPATKPAAAQSPSPTPPPLPEFWSEKGIVLTAGDFGHPEANGQLWFADSEIVRLPDSRLRIYMVIGSQSGAGRLGSMVSADGLHWTLEPGDRCRIPTNIACGQVAVLQNPAGGWKLFSSANGGIVSASSADGLTWKDDPGTRVSGASYPGNVGAPLSGPHITPVAAGGWRIYFHRAVRNPSCGPGTGHSCPGGAGPPVDILSAFSTDLSNWTPDPGIRSNAGPHPNVIALPAGGYRMFTNPGFDMLTAFSPDGINWPATFDPIGLQGGDPVPVLLPSGLIRLYYNDADGIAHQGGGLFYAEQKTTSWDLAFSGPLAIDVTGTGGPVTVRLTDHGRAQDRPAPGLPHTQRPPFSISIDLGGGNLSYQPLVEVSDGTMNRFIDGYACGLANEWPCPPAPTASGGCTPGTFCAGKPDNCGPGQRFACPSPAVACQKGQPIPTNGCITAGYDGLPRLCMPKGVDPSPPPICQQFY